MKKIISFFLAVLLVAVFVCSAGADTLIIDTEKASREEIKAAISQLNKVLANGNADTYELPKTFTYSNGFTITIETYKTHDGLLDVYFTFSHQYDQPISWAMNVVCNAYQNGIELESDYSGEGSDTMLKTILAGGEGKVILSYILTDETDVTICVLPNLALTNWKGEYQYAKIMLNQ